MSQHKQRGEQRPYVADYGPRAESPAVRAGVGAGMVALALVLGFLIGLIVWGILWLSGFLTGVVWNGLAGEGTPPFMPLIICAVGGLVIGLWSRFFGGEPRPLAEVMGRVRKDGSYSVDNMFSSVVGFLLPLVFGGSVGPEAGLTGIVAAACSWMSKTLKKAGLKAKAVADLTVSATLTAIFGTPLAGIAAAAEDAMPATGEEPDPDAYTFRRSAKIVLYVAAAVGALAGMYLVGSLTGHSGGLPRFGAVEAQGLELLLCVPCIVAGYVLTLVFFVASRGCAMLGAALERFKVARAVLAGIVLGLISIALPEALFSGEEQSFEIMETWQAQSAVLLIATGVVKAALTPFCLHMGWRGGHFFPCIFAGICCGYGIALVCGADSMLCVTVVTASFVAGTTRKPLLALALLFLCFPVGSVVWIGLACVIGAVLPVPKSLLSSNDTQNETGRDREGSDA